jgi:Ca2+-binding EF-hand superfamily protein
MGQNPTEKEIQKMMDAADLDSMHLYISVSQFIGCLGWHR